MSGGEDNPGGASVPRHVPNRVTREERDDALSSAPDVGADSDSRNRGTGVLVNSATYYLDAEMSNDDLMDIASHALLANGDGKKTLVVAEDAATQDRYMAVEKKVCELAVAGLRVRGLV